MFSLLIVLRNSDLVGLNLIGRETLWQYNNSNIIKMQLKELLGSVFSHKPTEQMRVKRKAEALTDGRLAQAS